MCFVKELANYIENLTLTQGEGGSFVIGGASSLEIDWVLFLPIIGGASFLRLFPS